jgi:trigger factor
MSTWKLNEKSQGDLSVKIEGKTWSDAQVKAFAKLSTEVEISGFRKGHAPEALVRKQINPQQILIEAVDLVAQEALVAAVEENSLELVASPELKLDALTAEAVELTFVCTVKPEVTLGEYKGLPFEVEAVEISEEEITAELEKMREKYAEIESKEGAVADGDTTIIDFEGFKDDIAFDGGKGENHELVIGSNSFIPGFEEKLIGMVKDEEKDITLTFPEEYQAAELAGKEVVFKVKMNDIKVKVLPELNDELAKDMNIADVETKEALEEYVKNDIRTQKTEAAENEASNKLIETVINNATVDLPKAMIDAETTEMVNDYSGRLQQQGFQLDQFLQMTGQTEEQLREQMTVDAVSRVKLRLVLEKIAEVENIEATEEIIEAEYAKIAEQYSMEVEKIKEIIPADNLSFDVKLQKALELVKGK